MPNLVGAIQRQNGRKVLLTTISYTTSASVTTLPAFPLGTCTEDGTKVPEDPMLCLQPTTDVAYRFAAAGAAAGASNTNSIKVSADGQEYTAKRRGDVLLDVVGLTSAGTLKVFLILPGQSA